MTDDACAKSCWAAGSVPPAGSFMVQCIHRLASSSTVGRSVGFNGSIRLLFAVEASAVSDADHAVMLWQSD